MAFRQAKYDESLIFEQGSCENQAVFFKGECLDGQCMEGFIPETIRKESALDLPGLTEVEVARHYTRLSQMNWGVDSGMYPLGSCTMKYNPKFSEKMAGLENFTLTHPDQPADMVQGNLELIHELEGMLAVVGGVDAVTLQPAAGAHGEFTGLLMARAYHEANGEVRDEVILPDTAHGTNPASGAMAGLKVVEIPSKDDGCVDLEALEAALSPRTCAFMLTNPNTLGIFERQVVEIARIVHAHGALLYYDGANLNAIMGKTTPGKMGFDIVHFNLHKTFGTPHGGGGPGSGPIGVTERLEKFLPVPRVLKRTDPTGAARYELVNDYPESIGKIHGQMGNFSVLVKAYVYILLNGGDGLRDVSEITVLNSNYMRAKLEKLFPLPYPGIRKHEFVLNGSILKKKGASTLDAAKWLLDQGIHAPTIYFPQIFHEAMMIEPTETETLEEMDRFIEVMGDIIEADGEELNECPRNATRRRLDETFAAKKMIFTYRALREWRENETRE